MKKLLVLLVIIIALGVGAYYYFTSSSEGQDDVDQAPDATDVEERGTVSTTNLITGEEAPSQEDIDTIREIYDNPDATIKDCKKIENEGLEKECETDFIYREAVDTQNPDKCKELELESDQESCMIDAGLTE